MNESRSSFDSESNFSLVEHGSSSRVGRASPLGPGHGVASNGKVNSYSISTIMNAASSGPNLATTLHNLNPLRPTGPKTGATRGKPAAPIILSDLPKVSRADFVPYIDSIKEDYAVWSRLQSALIEPPILEELHDEEREDLDEDQVKRRQAVKDALDSSNLDQSVRSKRELPTLEAIPQIFFQESFNLANPHTFDEVTTGTTSSDTQSSLRPSSDTARSDTPGEVDQILQEKLTHYLDVVEVHLSVEIRVRSASFFSALSNLQALDTQSAEALKQIAMLKNMLQEVDESVARKGLDKMRQCRRRQRLDDLDFAIERVKEVLRALEQAEDLSEAGETQSALDLADELETEWESGHVVAEAIPGLPTSGSSSKIPAHAGLSIISEDQEEESPPLSAASNRQRRRSRKTSHHPPVRIARIAALSSVPTRLAKLRQYISHLLETEFVAVITHDARENLSAYQAAAGQWQIAGTDELSLHQQAHTVLEGRIGTAMIGLTRCGDAATDSAISAWRSALLAEGRRNLREQLPHATRLLADEDEAGGDFIPSSRSSLDGERPNMDGSNSALTGIRSLSHPAYMDSIKTLHLMMLGCISIADTQATTLLQVAMQAYEARNTAKRQVGPSDSAGDDSATVRRKTAVQTELQDGVQAVADLANIRLARIVTSRAEIHAALPLADFVAVFNASWQFVLSCEVICKKMIVGLRGVIVAQAKSFLQVFHQKHVNDAATMVETEQWSPVDVPSATQQIVDRVIESAINNPKSWDLSAGQGDNSAQAITSKANKHLNIEDKTYFAVGAALKLIEFLEEYLKVVVNLPLLTTDAMARIIELLKQFNSRVCQVVLGAGAMRSAGLKNITAKHLALASQSLSFMISLIPYIRECLRRHLRAKQAVILIDFDKLKRDYQEHQYEIHAKLVAIMGDRLAVHCAALQEIDWEADQADPNAYMQTLVKETATLHKVLYKYLPGSALETVMLQVLSAINSRLAEEYGKITVKSDAAKERILEDVKFMKSKFGELKGLERDIPGAGLEDLIRMKKVEKPVPVAAPKQFVTPSLTRSRGSISHKRTASSSSLLKAEAPTSNLSSEATTPDLASAISRSDPLDIKTDISPDQPSSTLVEAAAATSNAIEQKAEGVLPETIPLPPSPTLEAGESYIMEKEGIADAAEPVAVTKAEMPAPKQDEGPATPTKDIEARIPPVPEKTTSPPPPTSKSPPPPVSNVKNRLAGLFSKRPTNSLPKVELPKVSIPQLSNIGIPNLRTERLFSPERQQGSPAQARSSLDLPRARALMEKQDASATKEAPTPIPEDETVPMTAADAMEASALAQDKASAAANVSTTATTGTAESSSREAPEPSTAEAADGTTLSLHSETPSRGPTEALEEDPHHTSPAALTLDAATENDLAESDAPSLQAAEKQPVQLSDSAENTGDDSVPVSRVAEELPTPRQAEPEPDISEVKGKPIEETRSEEGATEQVDGSTDRVDHSVIAATTAEEAKRSGAVEPELKLQSPTLPDPEVIQTDHNPEVVALVARDNGTSEDAAAPPQPEEESAMKELPMKAMPADMGEAEKDVLGVAETPSADAPVEAAARENREAAQPDEKVQPYDDLDDVD